MTSLPTASGISPATTWIVFAHSGHKRFEYPVVGYFNSGRKLQELAGRLSLGGELEPAPGDRR